MTMNELLADIAIASLIMAVVTVIAYWRKERRGWK